MIDVLLVTVASPPAESLSASARNFQGLDVRLRLSTFSGPESLPESELFTERHSFSQSDASLGRKEAAAAQKAAAPKRAWMHAQRDTRLLASARKAKVLVALDAQAVYTVWQLARINPSAHACYGIAAALRAVTDRRERPWHYARADFVSSLPAPRALVRTAARRTRRLPKTVALTAIGPKVLRTGPGARAWRLAVAAPGLPENVRFRLAKRVGDGLRKANRPAGAVLALNSAAQQTHGLRHRADLLGAAAQVELMRGKEPVRLTDAVAAEVACADGSWGKKNGKAAGRALARAMELAFHRVLHFDRTESPMAGAPGTFLAPLHSSTAFKALTSGAGRDQAAEAPTGRPLRLLFVTRRNANFLTEIRNRYEAHPGFEVRSLDIATVPALDGLIKSPARMGAFRLGADPAFGQTAEEHLRPHLDWADTVFIDWATGPAVLFTAVDPGTTRIVVRLHSFETFSAWPFLTDFSRVDDLVFVGAHLRDLTVAATPALQGSDAPRLHVIHNAMDLDRYRLPKESDARFTIGLTGISAVAKDPRWAIDVVKLLRAEDERYRLFLIGADVDASLSPAAREYAAQYEREVGPLESSGAVRRLGQLSDVPQALTGIGVILSSSVRESFHCGFVEGAASGALPIARDWPFFAGQQNGAHTLFPTSWLATSPQEAADRILAVTRTEETWRAAAADAAEHARAAWNWPVVAQDFDQLLLNPGTSQAEGGESAENRTVQP
ncbi:glycosyltransferase [Streptomyces sp. NPDC052179]|uniref:glycosyltransferase n=1 Tax=Streptomyces sp. NPDC052179 TaxID=3155680 RepID=UPI003424857C